MLLAPSMADTCDNQVPDVQEDEAEESLSLSDLPLAADHDTGSGTASSSSGDPSQIFEFFTPSAFRMSPAPAHDLIRCGKLLPFKPHHPPPDSHALINPPLRLRSESLPESRTAPPLTSDPLLHLSGRSPDFRRKSRSTRSEPSSRVFDRNSSAKSASERVEAARARRPASRIWWHLPMFGLLKFPAEIAVGDMKSRLVRLAPKTIFPPADVPARRGVAGKGPWAILRILSCRDDASVSVATSFGCIPQVSDF